MNTFFFGQWAQKLQAIKFRGIKKTLIYLINGGFFLLFVTFQPFDLEKRFIPQKKALEQDHLLNI